MNAEQFAKRLEKCHRTTNGWMACCPAHEDRTPSLSIKDGEKCTVLYCHGKQCTPESIVAMVGLTMSDLSPQKEAKEERAPAQEASPPTVLGLSSAKMIAPGKLTEYGLEDCPRGVRIPYRDMAGAHLFAKTRIRYNGDRFRADDGAQLRPYGLWRIEEARDAELLYVVEGESCSWTLWSQGYPAIGIPGASNTKCLSEPGLFDGIKTVYVIREADEAGSKFAEAVCEFVRAAGMECFAVDLGAKDTSALYMRDPMAFRDAFTAACDASRKTSGPRTWTAEELQLATFPPRQWIVPGLLLQGLALMCAPPKSGKTRLLTNIAGAVAYGGTALGSYQCAKGGVLYFDLEGDEMSARERCAAIFGSPVWPRDLMLRWSVPAIYEGFFELVQKELEKITDPCMVVVDTLDRIWPTKPPRNFGNARDIEAAILRDLHAFAHRMGICLFLVHHPAKGESNDRFNASGTGAMLSVPDVIWGLNRKRFEDHATLIASGRGIPETEVCLRFDRTLGTWRAETAEDANDGHGGIYN